MSQDSTDPFVNDDPVDTTPDPLVSNPDTTVPDDAAAAEEGTVHVVARRGYKFVLPASPQYGDGMEFDDVEPVEVPAALVEELLRMSDNTLKVVAPENKEV